MKTITQNRPAGISFIAGLFLAAAIACLVTTACTALGIWPLAWGRYLVGDMVTMGPAIFALAAILYAVTGFGLLALNNWARRGAVVVTAVGLYFLVPPVSSAVADLRISGIAVNGAQIIVRVVVLWYLMQQDTATAFGA